MAGQLDLIDPQKRLETFEKISSEGLLAVNKKQSEGMNITFFQNLQTIS